MLVPLKALPAAKSRLAQDLRPDEHAGLVEAIRADTLAAARAASSVARVVVVTDQPGEFDADEVFVQHRPGLNPGLTEGAAYVAQRWPEDGVVALVGDLPALRPEELDAALVAATDHDRSFVPDAAGTGTTLLAARPGVMLDPRFGAGSAARHSAIAVPLAAGPGLRSDVDTTEELAQARRLGVGARTQMVGHVPRSPEQGKIRS